MQEIRVHSFLALTLDSRGIQVGRTDCFEDEVRDEDVVDVIEETDWQDFGSEASVDVAVDSTTDCSVDLKETMKERNWKDCCW